jgi:hypothetical protein
MYFVKPMNGVLFRFFFLASRLRRLRTFSLLAFPRLLSSSMIITTHTHTRTRTRARAHTHTHTHTHIRTRTHTNIERERARARARPAASIHIMTETGFRVQPERNPYTLSLLFFLSLSLSLSLSLCLHSTHVELCTDHVGGAGPVFLILEPRFWTLPNLSAHAVRNQCKSPKS